MGEEEAMKSITIKDTLKGEILIKLVHRKSGNFDLIVRDDIQGQVEITARDDKGCLVWFQGKESP